MQCPFIVPENEISKEGNKRVNYADFGGAGYIFYDHDDGFGHIIRVQFCKMLGRKKDVFECFNESEWHACRAYRSAPERDPHSIPAEEEEPPDPDMMGHDYREDIKK